MAVILSDEEFILIYQSLWLSRHPGGRIPLAILAGDAAIELVASLPDCALLAEQAVEQIPELEEKILSPLPQE